MKFVKVQFLNLSYALFNIPRKCLVDYFDVFNYIPNKVFANETFSKISQEAINEAKGEGSVNLRTRLKIAGSIVIGIFAFFAITLGVFFLTFLIPFKIMLTKVLPCLPWFNLFGSLPGFLVTPWIGMISWLRTYYIIVYNTFKDPWILLKLIANNLIIFASIFIFFYCLEISASHLTLTEWVISLAIGCGTFASFAFAWYKMVKNT